MCGPHASATPQWRHRAFGIEFRGLLKRADGRAMIEPVKKSEALIEIALCFGRVGRDLTRIGAESVVKRLLRGEHITDCKHDRGTDEDLKELALRFHSNSEQKICATAIVYQEL